MSDSEDGFCIRVADKYLIYSPLRRLTALVNRQAQEYIRASLISDAPAPRAIQPLIDQLRIPAPPPPAARVGPLNDPLFLGIIPTRGCNLACRYCDFAAPKQDSPVMDLTMARRAVDAYFDLLHKAGETRAEVHFFGGEPFFADNVIHFVVNYAIQRAADLGLNVSFEAITNGVFSASRCQWIADHFDTIVLSLDGLSDAQDLHRPALNGYGTFDIVARNARILSEGSVDLIVRGCITGESAAQLPEFARWIGRELRPSTVCLETLVTSPLSEIAGFTEPDPWEFSRYFDQAASILSEYGIETVISTADLRHTRATFCPVGQDALIISPDGAIDTCYLLEKDWRPSGLNLRLGWLRDSAFEIDPVALQAARNLTVHERPLCADCLCRYHCAGGCHVNHNTARPAGDYDSLCIQTRLITVARLLRKIGQHDLADQWLERNAITEQSVRSVSDRLVDLAEEHVS